MKTSASIVLLVLLLPVSTSNSQEEDIRWEGLYAHMVHYGRDVAYRVIDEVEDGCMPRPGHVEIAAEATLRRYNFKVSDIDQVAGVFIRPEIQIRALGYEMGESGICAVTVKTFVLYPVFSYVRDQEVFFSSQITD